MMTQDQTSRTPRWVRKLLIPAMIGAVAGFAASGGIIAFIDSSAVGGLSKSGMIAAVIAVLYALIGFGITIGTASPQWGARFLNVEDADELREQKRILMLSGFAMLLWGAALLALALAAPDGPLPQPTAAAISGCGLLIGIALSVQVYRASDELMAAVNLEAGALSYGLLSVVLGGWAMSAHLGYAAPPRPLELLSLFYVLVLVASFIAVGRRGMLAIR
ncbi:MAG: hypothetical protein HC774_00710 [Sphingomonadales bacterium]|nr:hypothetical protein [Sphingomonadales bacterium]